MERAEKNLNRALSGQLDLTAALEKKVSAYHQRKSRLASIPHHVTVDNSSSSFFTILEVFTYDFPGLTLQHYRCSFSMRPQYLGRQNSNESGPSRRCVLCQGCSWRKSRFAGAGGRHKSGCFREAAADQ